jgi:lipopolysaccharide transport system permease protein
MRNAMERSSLSPVNLVRGIVQHRYLLGQLISKSVRGAYGGSIGGLFWLVLKPLLMLAVYTLVFGYVFKSRFFAGTGQDDPLEFALALFCGLSIFTVLSEMLAKAPTVVTSNSNLVKKVVFPLDLFVVAELGATMVYFTVSFAIFVLAMLFKYGLLQPAGIWILAIMLPFVLITLGVSWFLAALGVYLRDISQLTQIVISVLMFLSPIFFPVSSLPAAIREWVWLNPVTYVVEAARAAFFLNTGPQLTTLVVLTCVGLLIAWFGWCFFQRTRHGFADVL